MPPPSRPRSQVHGPPILPVTANAILPLPPKPLRLPSPSLLLELLVVGNRDPHP